MVSTDRTIGAGGHLARRPLTGPAATAVAALDPALVLVYEGGGSWALLERRRSPRWTSHFIDLGDSPGRLCVIDDAYSFVKRYPFDPNLYPSRVADDVRRMLAVVGDDLLAEIDRHNDRVADSNRRDWRRETAARAAYWRDHVAGARHFAVDGFGGRAA